MLRSLYDRTMQLAARRDAVWLLAVVAFVESSIFPVPPDVMLIPMVLAARGGAWRFAAVCTVASVLGGLAGYAVGSVLFEAAGRPILELYGYAERFAEFTLRYNEYGAWIVFVAGVTPFPYKVITIASGAAQLDLATFTTASVLARGIRFFLVAALLYWIGPPVRSFIERRLGLMFTIFCVLLIGGFVLVRVAA